MQEVEVINFLTMMIQTQKEAIQTYMPTQVLKLTIEELRNVNASSFSGLEVLVLYQKGWTKLPPKSAMWSINIPALDFTNLRTFSSIRQLHFTNLPLVRIPDEVGSLANLETIQINYCQVADVAAEIKLLTQLKSLHTLDLEGSILELHQQEMIQAAFPDVQVIPSQFQDQEFDDDKDDHLIQINEMED